MPAHALPDAARGHGRGRHHHQLLQAVAQVRIRAAALAALRALSRDRHHQPQHATSRARRPRCALAVDVDQLQAHVVPAGAQVRICATALPALRAVSRDRHHQLQAQVVPAGAAALPAASLGCRARTSPAAVGRGPGADPRAPALAALHAVSRARRPRCAPGRRRRPAAGASSTGRRRRPPRRFARVPGANVTSCRRPRPRCGSARPRARGAARGLACAPAALRAWPSTSTSCRRK